ncbi:hypothetical protein LAZ67_12002044, partial [Cordylochernes scorpioides]
MRSNTNWKKAERDLNKTLLHLEKFANKHKLEFNPQKSETCLFATDKKLYKIRPKIILKEQQFQYKKHPKYLGYTLDPEINSSKHIEEVIRKGRDRLKILKDISEREWGADATTLKLTCTSLIRPILEYGYQIYCTASEINLKSLESIQLNVSGMLNHSDGDGSTRLPDISGIALVARDGIDSTTRTESTRMKGRSEKISPCEPLQNVIFNATLNEPTNKQYQNPEYLKQLSLEIITNNPKNTITIYTDGSRDKLGHTGTIYEALKSIININYQDIWILTDSRSAIQHLSHTGELRDKVSRNIISYLQKLSKTSKIHLQWKPSHVGIEGNEAADAQ